MRQETRNSGARAGYSHRGVHAESGGATPPPQHNSSPFIHPLSYRHVAPQTNSLKLANNGITAGIILLVGPMSTRSTREAPSTERVVVLFCGIPNERNKLGTPKCPLLRHTVSLETLMLVSCRNSRSARWRRKGEYGMEPQNTQHCCNTVNRIA